MLFPGKEWARRTPQEHGLGRAPLEEIDSLMRRAGASGVLVRHGALVTEWSYGDPTDRPLAPGQARFGRTTRFDVLSIGKSFVGLCLGLALDDGLITGLDVPVREVFPAFRAGPFTDRITIRHLATMTAGIVTTLPPEKVNYRMVLQLLPPGTALVYHNDQVCHLARALTYVFARPLGEVLAERILAPIGAEAVWLQSAAPWSPVRAPDGRHLPVYSSGKGLMWWAPADLGRVGLLFLHSGRWEEDRLLSAEYVRQTWTEIPQKDIRPHHWGDGCGLYWWRLWEGVWYMAGLGGQFCLVWPEQNLVMVKLNPTGREQLDPHGGRHVGVRDVFRHLYRSLAGVDFPVPRTWQVAARAVGGEDGLWTFPP